MFMKFHTTRERRPFLLAIFGSLLAIGAALWIIF